MKKVSQIAPYMQENPSLTLGLDGSMDPRLVRDRRVAALLCTVNEWA
jgi:hypothetical protein